MRAQTGSATRALALGAVWALAGLGCASGGGGEAPPNPLEPDRFLFERGTEALAEERWTRAREFFGQIVDTYPQSAFRPEARLGLGDAYLGEGLVESYVRAISEFRDFLTIHPTHPRADYAQYKLGLVHYEQMRRPERDQSETKETIRELEIFVQRYPNSQLMDEVRTKLREARDRLSQSEFIVGRYYYRVKWYPGAIDRFRTILDNDPGFTRRDAVYFHLGESLVNSNRRAEALPYYQRLIDEFEESEYLSEAQARLAELRDHDLPTF